MADITTWATADKDRPRLETGPTFYQRQFSLAAGNQNDVITLIDIEPGFVVYGATLTVSATLGTSCTLQLRQGTTALTAATTAAGADREVQSTVDIATTADRNLNVLIAGANVGATATVTVEAWLVKPPRLGA